MLNQGDYGACNQCRVWRLSLDRFYTLYYALDYFNFGVAWSRTLRNLSWVSRDLCTVVNSVHKSLPTLLLHLLLKELKTAVTQQSTPVHPSRKF